MTIDVARCGGRLVCDRLHCGNARVLRLGAKVLHFRANARAARAVKRMNLPAPSGNGRSRASAAEPQARGDGTSTRRRTASAAAGH